MVLGKIGVFGPVTKQIAKTITVHADKKIQFRDTGIFIQSPVDGKLLISSDGVGANDITLTGNVTITNDLTISAASTFDTGTGLTTIGGNYTITGHFDNQEFTANAFQFEALAEWHPAITGAVLITNQAAKKCWIPLNFLKIGDEIVSYKLVGDVHKEGGDTVTLDCKIVSINLGDPITTTDIAGGGMTQVLADGQFDVETTLGGFETVATDKQYALEILGTTSNVSANEFIKVMGAEVKVNRKT